jgi:hypothetical protein
VQTKRCPKSNPRIKGAKKYERARNDEEGNKEEVKMCNQEARNMRPNQTVILSGAVIRKQRFLKDRPERHGR